MQLAMHLPKAPRRSPSLQELRRFVKMAHTKNIPFVSAPRIYLCGNAGWALLSGTFLRPGETLPPPFPQRDPHSCPPARVTPLPAVEDGTRQGVGAQGEAGTGACQLLPGPCHPLGHHGVLLIMCASWHLTGFQAWMPRQSL